MKNIIIINLITTIRFIGVLLLYPIYNNNSGLVASLVCLICYLTDALDGYLARKLKVSTFFGSIYDTIADKLLNLISFFILYGITLIAMIPFILEILIIILNIIRFKANQNVRVKQIGRLKMVVLGITVIVSFILSDYNINNMVYLILFLPIIILSFATFYIYLKNFLINPKDFSKLKTQINLKDKLFDNEYFERNKDHNSKELLDKKIEK